MKKSSAIGMKSFKKKSKKKKATIEKESARNVARLDQVPDLSKFVFDPNFHPIDFVQHCREGNSPTYIAATWGINVQKLNRWVARHPQMLDAYMMGETCYKAFWLRHLKDAALNDGKGTGLKLRLGAFSMLARYTMNWTEAGESQFPGAKRDEYTMKDAKTGQVYDALGNEIEKGED